MDSKEYQRELIFLTNITLHTRDFSRTVSYSKVAKKGCLYSQLSKEDFKKTEKTNSFQLSIDLPQDLVDRMNRGEIEIMIPEDGLDVVAGFDFDDFLQSINGKRFLRGLAKEDK